MNPERPNDPREQMEVRITALLLGEASAFEEAELLEAIESDPALNAYYKEMRGVIGIVEETIQSAPGKESVEKKEQVTLDEKRRVKLQKLLKARKEAPIELNATPWWKRTVIPLPRFLEIAAVFAILAVLAGLFIPAVSSLSKRKTDDIAFQSSFRRDEFNEQSVNGLSALSGPSRLPAKNTPADLEANRSRRYGLVDRYESESPSRGELVQESAGPIAQASPVQQTANIFLPKQSTDDSVVVQNGPQSDSSRFGYGFEAKGVSDSGVADKQRQLREIQLGRNFAEQNVYFSRNIEASAEVTDLESPRAPDPTTTRGYRVSGSAPIESFQPDSRGRSAGTELMLGEQLVRENEPRGGRTANVETAGRGQATLAQSRDSSGDATFGDGLEVGGFGGGSAGSKNDFGTHLYLPGALPESGSVSSLGIVQSDGGALFDSYAFSNFKEPTEDQTVVSSIAPIAEYDVDFDASGIPQSDGRMARQSADKKSVASFMISPSTIPTSDMTAKTESLTTWQMQHTVDDRADWAETENSLGLATQSGSQGVRAGEQKAKPAPSARIRPTLAQSDPATERLPKNTRGSSRYRATTPNQDTTARPDQIELGFAVNDSLFTDLPSTTSKIASSDFEQAAEPVSGGIREQEISVGQTFRSVSPRSDFTDEQLVTDSRGSNDTPLPQARRLVRKESAAKTLNQDEAILGKQLTDFERNELAGLDKMESHFVEEQLQELSKIEVPQVQVEARFVEGARDWDDDVSDGNPIDSDDISSSSAGSPDLLDAVAVTGFQISSGRNPTVDMAVKESVRREADFLLMRQKLADANAATAKGVTAESAQLFEEGKRTSQLSTQPVRREFDSKSTELLALFAKVDAKDEAQQLTGARFAQTEFETLGQPESARTAKEKSNSSTEIRNAKLLMQTGRNDEALALLSETVERNPASEDAFRVLGQLEQESIREYREQSRKQGLINATTDSTAEGEVKIRVALKKKAEPLTSSPLPPDLEPRPEVQTAENAFSTFSLNVSDVSFKLAEASLENGQLPDGKKLRSEEFINAFDYHDPAPLPGQKLAFNWERARNPFAFGRDLLRFSIQTAAAGRQADQPLNLVVLLDNSGSMERSDRVEITHQMLAVLADQLNPNDRISVISFARTARLWVDGMPGGDPAELLRRVGRLNPEGGTNLEDALRSGYDIAQKHYNNYANNRVILLTDGAANLGNVDPKVLHEKVVEQRQRGIALDCFGVGWEGYNDSLLETLSRNGDGRYGFINRPEDAESEFADLLAGALQVAASDVKAQVEFNPERVTSYRQIGYLQHQLTKEQFRDNTVDAAEIGAAEAGNALYVTQINENGTGPIGTVRVRYRVPATGLYEEREWELPYNPVSAALETSSPAMKLAATSASFAEWLAQSPHAAEVTLGELQSLLNGVPEAFTPDSRPQELQRMIQATRSISGQ